MKAAIVSVVVVLALFAYFEHKTTRLANDRAEIVQDIEKDLSTARAAYLERSEKLKAEIDVLRSSRVRDSLQYAENLRRLKIRLYNNEQNTKDLLSRLDSIGDLSDF